MKNFNLISPSDNGFEYTIRFQDPIKIMPNSKIDFKFAELVRAGEVVFNEAQTITISVESADCLPQFDIRVDGTESIEPLVDSNGAESRTMVLSIPAGAYSYTDFKSTLETTITNGLKRTHSADIYVNNFKGFAVASDTDSGTKTDIAFGIDYDFSIKDASIPVNNIELDAGGEYQMNVQVSSEMEITKTSGGTNGQLDAGAIINPEERYIHRYYKNNLSAPANNYENCIYLEGNDDLEDQVGSIHFGFYNIEVSKVLGLGTNRLFANGSGGTNQITHDGEQYLPVPLGVRVGAYGEQIEIYQGFGSGFDNIGADNMLGNINQIAILSSVPVHDYFDEGETPKFFFQMYQTRENIPNTSISFNEERDTYYRLFALNHKQNSTAESFNMELIYDSAIHGEFLTHNFEVAATGITYGQAPNALEKAKSQVPYQLVVGMTQQDEGWKKITYPKLDFTDGLEQCLLLNYKMSFSDELARALNIPVKSKVSELELVPNFLVSKHIVNDAESLFNNANLFHNSNIANPWKRDSYSIFIDLPCNNYKNVSDKLNGGFRKSVIANIPSPFSSADIVEGGNTNNEMVATYEPYQQVSSELKNNEISVNSFKISILDMKTEQLAKQLSASVVNFSIHCPEGSSCS